MFEDIEYVVGKTGQKINDKPGFQIVLSYYTRFADNFPARTHESGVKVQHDINKKDNIHDRIQDKQFDGIQGFGFECHVVGYHYSRVES